MKIAVVCCRNNDYNQPQLELWENVKLGGYSSVKQVAQWSATSQEQKVIPLVWKVRALSCFPETLLWFSLFKWQNRGVLSKNKPSSFERQTSDSSVSDLMLVWGSAAPACTPLPFAVSWQTPTPALCEWRLCVVRAATQAGWGCNLISKSCS